MAEETLKKMVETEVSTCPCLCLHKHIEQPEPEVRVRYFCGACGAWWEAQVYFKGGRFVFDQ